ncbi:MAG: HAD family phosphatase [Clostridiales bacterium]|nr:HAD family phosphatase [Clostridiales bacterium]
MGSIRLIAMDMDGTLLNSAHETTRHTRGVLARAAERGITLALCTGRCLSELREHLLSLDMVRYVIGENGACVYDVRAGRAIAQRTLPAAAAEDILTRLRGYDALPQVFVDNVSHMQCAPDSDLSRWHVQDYMPVFRAGSRFIDDALALCRPRMDQVEKINAYFAHSQDKARFGAETETLPVQRIDSLGTGYEISPEGATKGAGLRALCDHLGLPLESAMAIGDGGNDVDLMRAAGRSVAMGNAIASVRAAADYVTYDCDHEGAAAAIERFGAL